MYLAIMWRISGHGDKADGHAIDALRRTALASSRGYRQVSVDIEREARNVNWNDLGHTICSMVTQPAMRRRQSGVFAATDVRPGLPVPGIGRRMPPLAALELRDRLPATPKIHARPSASGRRWNSGDDVSEAILPKEIPAFLCAIGALTSSSPNSRNGKSRHHPLSTPTPAPRRASRETDSKRATTAAGMICRPARWHCPENKG
jgi:hypothetical protein